MSIATIVVYVASAVVLLLAVYAVAKDLPADLVLLGGCALLLLLWLGESAALGIRDLRGGDVPDAVTLYGYLLTGLVLPLGGIWLGLGERTRWGSGAIALVAITLIVLQARLPQIWPGGFA